MLDLASSQAGHDYDVARVRSFFPAMNESEVAFFDGPGGTQTPTLVAEAMSRAICSPLSNRGRQTIGARNAEHLVQECRSAVGDLLGVPADLVVHGRSATALNFTFSHALSKEWAPGDEVVVSRLDHDANVRPWVLAAERAGARVRFVDFDPATGELTPQLVANELSDRTQLVAITAASNLIGTMPDVKSICEIVHQTGALVYLDGVHYAAHQPVDFTALGADLFVFSPYKLLGPHCGFATGRRELLERLHPDKLAPSPDNVPERFELGTLPYEHLAGVTAAINFIADIGGPQNTRREALTAAMTAIDLHELRLRTRMETALLNLPGVTSYSRANNRTPTLLVEMAGVDSGAVASFLGKRNIATGAGAFYCNEAAQRLGLGDAGALRIGLAPYNNDEDVDRLIHEVTAIAEHPDRIYE